MEPCPRLVLNNGTKMPALGFGVYQIPPGPKTKASVASALKTGYRLIDTATLYRNEKSVGQAVSESKIERKEVFVTTKLWNSGHSQVLEAFDESLSLLGFEYIDLYLIHWPVPGKRINSWKAIEKIYETGKAKAIGVSNFTINHLEELLEQTRVVPAVNQVEFNPFIFQKELLEYCKKKEIQLQAYCPLSQGQRLGDKTLKKISAVHNKTTAQIMLRWAVQHGVIPIPKSVHEERIVENSKIFDFELSSPEMKELDGLNENFRVSWNPETIK